MDVRALRNVPLLAAVAFVTGVLVLAIQLITPSPVVVSLGESGTQPTSVGRYFTYSDVAVVVGSSVLCGASGAYLVLYDQAHRLLTSGKRRDSSRGPSVADGVERGDGGVGTRTDATTRTREEWEETVDRLKNNQRSVYTRLVEADGELPQRELVDQTELSKATVSRTLDKLENRGLVERKRNGMGNTVQLL